MSNFDSKFSSISIKELVDSLSQMKEDIQAGIREGSEEFKEEGDFLLAIIANLENEVKDEKNLENLELNKKVRVIAFMNLFYECLNATLGDDEDDFDEDDDDYDDEDYEDDDAEDAEAVNLELKSPSFNKVERLSLNTEKDKNPKPRK